MTVSKALSQAAALGLDRLDAQLLLLHAQGRPQTDRGWLLAHDTQELSMVAQEKFLHQCQSRAAGEPLAYLVGHKEFFGLDLLVDRRVLIPRPDTETLVEWALELLACRPALDPPRVIDLGTGSGAIALAIKKHWPQALIEAVDASPGALEVARKNAQRLSLAVAFRQASWLTGTNERYDLIVSNPPYVAANDPHLEALSHEPLNALVAGTDGLADLRSIIAQAPAQLRPGGRLLLEHGCDQAQAVRILLRDAGFESIAGRRDLAGLERCSGGKWLERG